MKNKLFMVCGVIIFIFILSIQPAMADDNVLFLDSKSAVDRALSQNSDILLTVQQLYIAKDRLDDAVSEIDHDTREKTVDDLNNKLAQLKEDTTINVTQLYYDILIKQKQAALQKNIVTRLNSEYDAKKKQVELGHDTDESLAAAELNILNAQTQLSDLENQLDGNIMDLNVAMGDNIDQKFTLKEEEIPEDTLDMASSDIDTIAKDLPNHSNSVSSIIESINIASEQEDSANGASRQQYQDQVLSLGYDIEDEKTTVEYNVRTGYNNILNMKDDMTAKKLDSDINTRLYEAAGIKYNLGRISSIEMVKASQTALNAQYIYLQSKLDYYLEIKKFKYMIAPALVK